MFPGGMEELIRLEASPLPGWNCSSVFLKDQI